MVRRFGTLGVGVFLTLSLTTGCVTSGDYAAQMPPVEAMPRPVQPRPIEHPPIAQLPVSQPLPAEQVQDIAPPKPPPPPEIVPATSALPEPLGVPATISVNRIPTEANESSFLVATRCALEKHHPEMIEALQQKYDQRTQEVLVPLLSLAARVSEGGVDSVSPQEMATLNEQLEQMKAALRVRTPLTVEKMCYCRRITNYGLYDPLPNDHLFTGGDRHHVELVQLYVEARNFASKQNGNVYETSLGSKLEITNKNDEIVARMDFPAKPDHSLSPRQDYFIHYQFYVPAQMEPGDYKLWITLHDENAVGDQRKQTVKHYLPFRVSGETPARATR
jgi:hypothetical protein